MAEKPTLASVFEHYTGIATRKRTVLCPLPGHEDSTPSCSVDWDRGLWNCHVCNEGGDAWTLIMLIEDCPFRTATELAQKYELDMGDSGDAASGSDVSRWGRPITKRTRKGKAKKFRPRFERGG